MPKTVRNVVDFNEKDLIDGKHRRDAAGVLKIAPLAFMVELYYFSTSRVQKSVAKEVDKACKVVLTRIKKLINTEVATLVKDVLALQKKDSAGDKGAADKAGKLIKAAVSKLDDTYPDQLRDELRKAVDKLVAAEKSNPVFQGVKSKSETAGRHGFRSTKRAILVEPDAFQFDAVVDSNIEQVGASVFTEGKMIQEEAGKEEALRKTLRNVVIKYEGAVIRSLRSEPGYPFRGKMPKDQLESLVNKVSLATKGDREGVKKAHSSHADFLFRFLKSMQGTDKHLVKMSAVINDKKRKFPDRLRDEAKRDLVKMQKGLRSLEQTLKEMVARDDELGDHIKGVGIQAAIEGAPPWSKSLALLDKTAYSVADVKSVLALGKKVQKVVGSAGK